MSENEMNESSVDKDTGADQQPYPKDENVTPISDEQKEQLKDKRSREDILEFHRIIAPDQSIEALAEAMSKEHSLVGSEEFARQIGEISSIVGRYKRMLDAHTDQTLFTKKALDAITNPNMVGDEYKYTPKTVADGEEADPKDTPFTIRNRVLTIDKSFGGAEVSGQQARILILANNRNVKKVYLYNSGFYIVLKGPSLVDVNLVYNRLSENLGDYGRILGAIFYMYSDYKIKEIIWEFVESLIIDSNLNKWDKGNRLRDNISLLDYQLILLSIGSLMFKNGYDFVHACTNDQCKHTETEAIDLSLLQLTDFGRLEHDQLRFVAQTTSVTPDDLRKYRKSLKLDGSIDVDNYRFHRKVPTIGEYLNYGNTFNEELMMSIHDIKDTNIIDQYLKFNYSRLFEPWIAYIEGIHADSKEVSFKVVEREAISLILNQIQSGDHAEEFANQMNEFINKSPITNIGYLAKPCSNCKEMPSGASTTGFVPLDAQNSFFTMLAMRLIQAS